jgi:alanine dehydrogenase
MKSNISIGLPRMHLESGEKRDFLPEFVRHLYRYGFEIFLEHGYGMGMGFQDSDYLEVAPTAHFSTHDVTFEKDIVLVLRYLGDNALNKMQPGACLISMLHYPTRSQRVELLKAMGLEAISLDSIKDDVGRRLVENLRAVAWNGVEIAFKVLKEHYPAPGLEDPNRLPIKVTVLGAGAVGMFAIQAAIRYGNEKTWRYMASIGATGVQVTAVDYDLTNHPVITQQILKYTDILVDATQRSDPKKPVVQNEWIGLMRQHAVLLDLSVDPYDCVPEVRSVKGIEGIPQGNLDQYIFTPDDPAYEMIPTCVRTNERRLAVSCYSWPGIYPKECMEIYGKQLDPLMHEIAKRGGVQNINPNGSFFQRAIGRALLSNWINSAEKGKGQ